MLNLSLRTSLLFQFVLVLLFEDERESNTVEAVFLEITSEMKFVLCQSFEEIALYLASMFSRSPLTSITFTEKVAIFLFLPV